MPIYGADGMAVPRFLEIAGKAADGVILTKPFHPEQPSEKTQTFIEAFHKKFLHPPDSFAALGYDSLQLVAQAIRQENPSPAGVHRGLSSLRNFVGATGPCTFDPSGNINRKVKMVRVKKGAFVHLEAQR